MEMLKKGTKISLSSGEIGTIERFLASGGQGAVYEIAIGKKLFALKWYFRHLGTAVLSRQRVIIDRLIQNGAPSEHFLWPLMTAETDADSHSFGYVMPLRENRFKNIPAYLKNRMNPAPEIESIISACYQLCISFRQLHAKGYAYQDINYGNIFLDPCTGDVKICDNDNVMVDGSGESSVRGTQEFMAPEIVVNDAVNPSRNTDNHSLAVLLFILLFRHHPLKGTRELAIRCMDLAAMKKLFGTEPLYIFDPKDHSNHPDPVEHPNPILFERVYPSFLKDVFMEAFTTGLFKPNERITDGQWASVMADLADSRFVCVHCGETVFYDDGELKRAGKLQSCWSCWNTVQPGSRIRITRKDGSGGRIVQIHTTTKFYPHHVGDSLHDFSSVRAEVSEHPEHKGVWGLKNCGDPVWICTRADGSVTSVESGKTVPLQAGMVIDFGNRIGEIRS